MAKKTPPQNRPPQAVARAPMQIQAVAQSFEGPIPPPAELKHYNDIIPGAAERILCMAERESAHRHSQEVGAMQANIAAQQRQLDLHQSQTRAAFRSDTVGQLLGFAVSLASITGCVYLASVGQPWVAAALVGLPLAGIIRALREKAAAPQKTPAA